MNNIEYLTTIKKEYQEQLNNILTPHIYSGIKQLYKDVKDIVRKLDINLIDIEQSLLSLENDPKKMFPFNLPGHFNIFGYKKVSDKIYEAMKDN